MNPTAPRSPRRRICVTGAASGIGLATAERFLAGGASVVLVDRDAERLATVVADLSARFGAVQARIADVGAEQEMAGLFSWLAGTGGLTTLVLAAGVTSDGYVAGMSAADWSYIIGVNLTGAFLCLRHGAPLLREAGGRGSVVAVGSVSAHVIGAGGGCAAYEASKAGLLQLVRAFAVEEAGHGVRANVVSPGRIRTRLGQNTQKLASSVYTSADAPKRPRHAFAAPLRQEGSAEEVAAAIHFLAGDEARFVTGSELVVDGGYTAI
jgi:2-keto-3-deoxy-L-fuconate dehydrogenase